MIRKILIVLLAIGLFAFVVMLGLSLYNNIQYPLLYEEEIKSAAFEYDVEPHFIASMINVESSFDKYAVSEKGAVGLMQLLPSTAIGLQAGLK